MEGRRRSLGLRRIELCFFWKPKLVGLSWVTLGKATISNWGPGTRQDAQHSGSKPRLVADANDERHATLPNLARASYQMLRWRASQMDRDVAWRSGRIVRLCVSTVVYYDNLSLYRCLLSCSTDIGRRIVRLWASRVYLFFYFLLPRYVSSDEGRGLSDGSFRMAGRGGGGADEPPIVE